MTPRGRLLAALLLAACNHDSLPTPAGATDSFIVPLDLAASPLVMDLAPRVTDLAARHADYAGMACSGPLLVPVLNPPALPRGAFGSLATDDLDGDGHNDLVASLESGAGVVVAWGTGKGTFSSVDTLAVGSSSSEAVAVGDLDGDGQPDIAVTLYSKGVAVLRGMAARTFAAPTIYPIVAGVASAVAMGDFNEDGKRDLLVGTDGAGRFNYFAGLGNATLAQAIQLPASPITADVVRVADIDRDGHLDILTSLPSGMGAVAFLGDGKAGFPGKTLFADPGVTGYLLSMLVVDVNRDGAPDVLYGTQTSQFIGVVLARGQGQFDPPLHVPAFSDAVSMASGDFNDDGRMDVVVAQLRTNSIEVLTGHGDGSFDPPVVFPLGMGAGAVRSIVTGDFNEDGQVDVAASGGLYTTLKVLLGGCR